MTDIGQEGEQFGESAKELDTIKSMNAVHTHTDKHKRAHEHI